MMYFLAKDFQSQLFKHILKVALLSSMLPSLQSYFSPVYDDTFLRVLACYCHLLIGGIVWKQEEKKKHVT